MNNEIKLTIIKRSGQHVDFDGAKICLAIRRAFLDLRDDFLPSEVNKVYNAVLGAIAQDFAERKTINIEDIQDIIEQKLAECGYAEIAESFHEYRARRAASRKLSEVKKEHKFLKIQQKLALAIAEASNRAPMESIIQYGQIVAREQAKAYLLDRKYARAHDAGEIYIHHLGQVGVGAVSEVTVDALNLQSKMSLAEVRNFLKNLRTEVSGRIKICNLDKAIENYRLEELRQRLVAEVESRLCDYGLEDLVESAEIRARLMRLELGQRDFSDFGAKMVCKIVENSYIMVERDITKRVDVEVNKLKRDLIESGRGYTLAEANEVPLVVAKTSVNLPRVAYEARDGEDFLKRLDTLLDFVKNELVAVYDYLGNRLRNSYKYLFSAAVLPEAAKLAEDQRVRKILRSGALEINLVGLRQAADFLGEGKEFCQEILAKISEKAEKMSASERIKFIIAEGSSYDPEEAGAAEYFLQIDKSIFGERIRTRSYFNFMTGGKR